LNAGKDRAGGSAHDAPKDDRTGPYRMASDVDASSEASTCISGNLCSQSRRTHLSAVLFSVYRITRRPCHISLKTPKSRRPSFLRYFSYTDAANHDRLIHRKDPDDQIHHATATTVLPLKKYRWLQVLWALIILHDPTDQSHE
jgi:hypothetical protein